MGKTRESDMEGSTVGTSNSSYVFTIYCVTRSKMALPPIHKTIEHRTRRSVTFIKTVLKVPVMTKCHSDFSHLVLHVGVIGGTHLHSFNSGFHNSTTQKVPYLLHFMRTVP